ncbi:helix-turn-helix transcriptional regulator [Rouxiella silvae]|uniref:Helix-turn-helix transcriptional regulator n=1 Tax=Rouxiella silvae TaxID=1646373 RepID=A0AA40X3N2_9GAMM|nr:MULTISPECIES: helix-turn-helix transcriptional regulator [Rouxiella]KAB7896422.1 helix-turn-helix domain-containing protein [Rouxiella sp. S1S-2]MBF6637884.1 helix-turn-helix transcriptional regulator [Rouxiella silvae]MCC3705205.1 helix-turn-helix domain-containing protein [Rouxiella badensis]
MFELKRLRKNAKLTQEELASLVGASQGAISHYETGRRIPDVNTCRALVSVLSFDGNKLSIEDLFPHSAGPEHAGLMSVSGRLKTSRTTS